jgi:hypothetical protein
MKFIRVRAGWTALEIFVVQRIKALQLPCMGFEAGCIESNKLPGEKRIINRYEYNRERFAFVHDLSTPLDQMPRNVKAVSQKA